VRVNRPVRKPVLEKLLKGLSNFKSTFWTSWALCNNSYQNRPKTATASSFPFVTASPPGFVTLEEIMKAANSVSNMTLAHEIAVDVDFHLQKLEPPSNRLVLILYFNLSVTDHRGWLMIDKTPNHMWNTWDSNGKSLQFLSNFFPYHPLAFLTFFFNWKVYNYSYYAIIKHHV